MSFYSKGITGASYFYSLILLLLGYCLIVQEESVGQVLLILGLGVQLILLLISTIKSILLAKTSSLWAELVLALMTVTFFAKYLDLEFWDIPSLVIIPAFIAFALYTFSIKKGRHLQRDLRPSIIVYLFLTLPLFYSPFYISPREYLPTEWYNRYNVEDAAIIELPYGFENPETEKLSIEAFELQANGEYNKAIKLYKKALKIEPKNPNLYFGLAHCYSNVNDLESALVMLDSAISIDSEYPHFYNNRGLLYYKLEKYDVAIRDYQKAISLNPKEWTFYANLSLAQYSVGSKESACKSLWEAEQLGMKIDTHESLKYLSRNCSR